MRFVRKRHSSGAARGIRSRRQLRKPTGPECGSLFLSCSSARRKKDTSHQQPPLLQFDPRRGDSPFYYRRANVAPTTRGRPDIDFLPVARVRSKLWVLHQYLSRAIPRDAGYSAKHGGAFGSHVTVGPMRCNIPEASPTESIRRQESALMRPMGCVQKEAHVGELEKVHDGSDA